MAFSYFAPTLMTLLILSGLTVMMYLNHTEKIPATRFFALGIALLLTVTVADAVAAYCADSSLYVRYPALCVRMRTAADTISYMLRPFIILTEVFALIPEKKKRLICAIPAVLNAILYSWKGYEPLCVLEYYIYLFVIYQQEIKETLRKKELENARNEILSLHSQIQPHFIYNSLYIIRSLAKRDGKLAVQCIDDFSGYLKTHIRAIQSSDLIWFEEELRNVQAYLALVQMDQIRRVEVVYDIGIRDFRLPPLSLEPRSKMPLTTV